MKPEVSIMWFRRDLRTHDNHAFFESLKSAKESGVPVLPVFIFDPNILKKLKAEDDARVTFLHQVLENFEIPILVLHTKPLDAFKGLVDRYSVKCVYTNHDYEPYAIERDTQVENLLKKNSVEFRTFKDQCVFEKLEVCKDDGTPYTVFTPYKKKWLKQFSKKSYQPFPSEKLQRFTFKDFDKKFPSLEKLGFKRSSIDFPSKNIKAEKLKNYDKNRDFPALDGTSHLGLHLRFGTTSIRRAVEVAYKTNQTFLSELIWRDFFMQILFNFPHVVEQSFRPEYDAIQWRNKEDEFKKWCEGRTGFPIVDAGMRELNATGYMHNRVRMITASFLTKDLLIDWRWGERYFAEKLLDYELAANNGNWQWAAGTGCDAAPYFRVFSPEQQTKKFDPKMEYIRKWIPELDTPQYPEPMLDHSEARIRAVLAYKRGLEKGKKRTGA